MSNEYAGLASAVDKFKDAVKKELDNKNGEFHEAINDEEPITFKGLGSEGERSEYLVDPSDVLFWHDPTAYLDELERWKGQKVLDEHLETRKYLDDSDQLNPFSRLVEAIKRGRVAPFVGAGLSYPYKLPLWGQALERLVTKLEGASKSDQRAMLPALQYLENVKELLDQWKYLEAAQLIYENHKTRFESFVLNTFDGSNVLEFFGVLDLLPQLSDGCIITTNFDNLIERVYTEKNRSIEGYMHGTQSRNQFASKLIQGERCILKLHGNYSDPETYIFSKSQYDQAYGEESLDYTKPLAKVLRQIFVSHSLLFLGCSLETDKTLELFIDVVSSEAFDIPAHFAFLPDPSNHQKKLEKEDLLAKAKIHPIWYQVAIDDCGTQNHSQLEDLIKFAVACATGKAKV
ncbi:SIR2 family protein [Alteromonas macleodii]|jgi:hypothetical protein|nr:hypothetical protein VCSRO125_3248 [Vibrio cholerae]